MKITKARLREIIKEELMLDEHEETHRPEIEPFSAALINREGERVAGIQADFANEYFSNPDNLAAFIKSIKTFEEDGFTIEVQTGQLPVVEPI